MPKPPASSDSEEPPALLAPPELNPGTWQRAAHRLLAKMISEFAYEEIIEPLPQGGDDRYALRLDDGETLSFRARRGAYGSWQVVPDSVECDGAPLTDPLRFLVGARRLLSLDGATLGHLVRELNTTLAADCRLDHTALPAARLAELDYAALEGHQTGHPWLVLNKGRLGFSARDAARWAPEARTPARLPWIAVSTRLAAYRGVPGLADPRPPLRHGARPRRTRRLQRRTPLPAAPTPPATSSCPCTHGNGTRCSCPSTPPPSPAARSSR